MPRGSKPGERRGGRKAGTPNKATLELKDRLAEAYPDYDPVMAMAALANDPAADPIVRFNASKEVAQYVHAKRKAVEHSGKVEKDDHVHVTMEVIGDDKE